MICTYLHKDSEEDDRDDGSEEHVLHLIVLHLIVGQQEPQWESYGASQATVGDDELVLFGQLHNPELIDDVSNANDTWKTDC